MAKIDIGITQEEWDAIEPPPDDPLDDIITGVFQVPGDALCVPDGWYLDRRTGISHHIS